MICQDLLANGNMTNMQVRYITHSGDDTLVVNAARVSFKKEVKEFSERDERIIKYLAEHNHWTPFGHPQITLHMKAPISIRTQCFKHKVGFCENEVSRRYVDDEPDFFEINDWRKKAPNKKQGSLEECLEGDAKIVATELYRSMSEKCKLVYQQLLEIGVCPEQCRFILPQGMITCLLYTSPSPRDLSTSRMPSSA